MVVFQGAKLSRNEAKRVSLTIVIGVTGLLITDAIFSIESKAAVYSIAFIFVLVGYFGIAKRVFPKKK